MNTRELQDLILSEKKMRDTVVLAHTYQSPEIIDIADFAGDSFALSAAAQKYSNKRIIVCGVRFMGETVKILSPKKQVILPEPAATCPMADQISPQRVADFRKEHPEYTVVAYINTSTDLKTQCDVCVTSSSAVKIIKAIKTDKILFIPDKNLGTYIKSQVPDKEFIFWDGCCPVHNRITKDDVLKAKAEHPNAKLAVHPECKWEVLQLADFIGSTSAIIEYALKSQDEVIIGTERGVFDYLSQKNPNKVFYQLCRDKLVCENMKMTSLDDVYKAIIGECGESIEIEEEKRLKAKYSIDNMLKYGG